MSKFKASVLAVALSFSVFSVLAATPTSKSDDASATGASETPLRSQQDMLTNKASDKKSMSKKERMHKKNKKMNAEKKDDENTNSMNDKPIGTTNGVSNNGSTDDTKMGEPINGTTTGTNNSSSTRKDN